MTTALTKTERRIARPLKVLIPLIKADLERGDRAGMEAYADAGDKMIEAKDSGQVAAFGPWVNKHFSIRDTQAKLYMRWARMRAAGAGGDHGPQPNSLRELRGATERDRAHRQATQPLRMALSDLDTDLFAQEKQSRTDEIGLHREMALEVIDIGYKALATRLHPDRGGSKDAMVRLNRVREELQDVAKTRRFV